MQFQSPSARTAGPRGAPLQSDRGCRRLPAVRTKRACQRHAGARSSTWRRRTSTGDGKRYDPQRLMAAETHQELRAAVRDLRGDFPDAYWRDLDAKRAYPEAFVKALTAAGYLAALIPEEFGGSGLGLEEAAVILEEVNHSGANSGACHAQMYTMGTLLRHGSDEQKERWLPPIAAGELRLQALGVTEPDAGLDTTSIRTRARRDGDTYTIDGQKIWTSRALQSDLMLLLARTS